MRRALIAEDEPAMSRAIRRAIETELGPSAAGSGAGLIVECEEVATPAAAFAAARRFAVGELAELIRAVRDPGRPGGTYALIVSAAGDDRLATASQAAAPDDWLPKPFSVAAIAGKVRDGLARIAARSGRMNKLEEALGRAKAQLPNCVAVGYVDMAQGALLASRIDGNHPAEVLQLVAAATAEQMQGPTVTEIERQFAAHKGAKHVERMISELTFKTSSGLYHVVLRCQKNPEHALVVVCGRGANPGMVSAKAAVALPLVEAAF